jgi:hypothetical protein
MAHNTQIRATYKPAALVIRKYQTPSRSVRKIRTVEKTPTQNRVGAGKTLSGKSIFFIKDKSVQG